MTTMDPARTDAIVPATRALHFAVVRFEALRADLDQVYRALGLRPERREHGRWIALVQEMAAGAPRLLRPRAVFRVDEVRRLETRRLELSSNVAFEGGLARFLEHARYVASFVVTIGSALERVSRFWLRHGQVMRGSIADALASEYADATAERCRQEIRAWARAQGLDVTPAYSPGYCGLHVTQQVPLFDSLPVAKINVRLTASCLMVPIKSVSALVGIGSPDKVNPDEYVCTYCEHPDCKQRRAPFAGGGNPCVDWSGAEDDGPGVPA